ncbi:MAG: hypothetical protein GC131_02375 [Alphaproteobacteria bacterium]|nr:hypothetical protein [Alphaproteobacteria bacterium]
MGILPQKDIRTMRLDRVPVALKIDQGHISINPGVEASQETIYISVALQFKNAGAEIAKNWNWEVLNDWLIAQSGKTLSSELEYFADAALMVALESARAQGIKIKAADVMLERPDVPTSKGTVVATRHMAWWLHYGALRNPFGGRRKTGASPLTQTRLARATL